MKRSRTGELADRLRRRQRVGVFGHRGVGKTTLLTMLYREASAGRLTGLRLAAADDETARYLAERVQQLEAGERLPATLDETQLSFHLYQGRTRLELVLYDYQGEHVQLGRKEPIRDYFRECDAVLLCVDASLITQKGARFSAEQEIEQLIEDYLASAPAGEPHRPMALVITKADLLGESGEVAKVRALVDQTLKMTRHALGSHCPWQGVIVLSSLGDQPKELAPRGLQVLLGWLIGALQKQDEARLERLWEWMPREIGLLGEATEVFLRRYPQSDRAEEFQQRLRLGKWKRRGRRLLAGGLGLGLLLGVLWGHDVQGVRWLPQALTEQAGDLTGQRDIWRSYQLWYPTRYLFRPGKGVWEREQIRTLEQALVESKERQAKQDREERGEAAVRELEQAEGKLELSSLIELAHRLAQENAGSSAEASLLSRRATYLRRQEDRAYEEACDYSRRYPMNFFTRRQKYQDYLDRHPEGAHGSAAREALRQITREWDRHDYRVIRELYLQKPGEVGELQLRARGYLSAHPEGAYRRVIEELDRFCEQIREPGEYRVTLRSGSFQKKVAHLLSRGPYLSVELEVGGVRYGPSTIVSRSYTPEWEYEFPRKIKWKRGDAIRILVTDNYYWKRRVGDLLIDEDPLALGRLNGEVELHHGTLTFSTDFKVPVLPRAE